MAKGEQKSNREKKKPKQVKTKPAPATSTFSRNPGVASSTNAGNKK